MAEFNEQGKKIRRFFAVILSAVLVFAVSVFSAPVSFETAEVIARKHLELGAGSGKIRRGLVRKVRAITPYFVFEKESGGFIVVSADDVAVPILGETDSGAFDKDGMPSALVWLLETYEKQIEEAVTGGEAQDDETSRRWKRAAQGSNSSATVAAASYPLTLLSTTWSQGAPYNLKTPLDGNARSATGCVATAIAQIMKYWQHPAYGTGASEAYKTVPKDISVPSVSFNTLYNYADMLDNYPTANSGTEAQREAVATLMYHCGVSVKMNYTSDESGALPTNVSSALTKYFGYDACIQNIATGLGGITVSASDWKDLVIGQIENNSPIYYNGVDTESGGHAFVIDGYDNSTDRFHLNWGWGGNYNGFFALTALNPGTHRYNNLQGMIINIMPDQGGNPPSQIKVSGFDVAVTETAVSANIQAKINYGAGFSGKIGFAAVSDGVINMVLDSANYSVSNSNTSVPLLDISIYTVNYKNANLSKQLGADTPWGTYTLQVVTKRGAGDWTTVGETREIFIPNSHTVTDSTNSDTTSSTSVYVVAASDRVAPAVRSGEGATVAAPINPLTAEFTAGPNPAVRPLGSVRFFRNGSRIESASLLIYDASGNIVNRVRIEDNWVDAPRRGAVFPDRPSASSTKERRAVGSWDLTDMNGRSVSAGTYLVRGAVNASGGKRELVSVTVAVR